MARRGDVCSGGPTLLTNSANERHETQKLKHNPAAYDEARRSREPCVLTEPTRKTGRAEAGEHRQRQIAHQRIANIGAVVVAACVKDQEDPPEENEIGDEHEV